MYDQQGLPAPRGRRLALAAVLVVVALSALYVLLPAIAGLQRTWSRIAHGDALWLIVAAGLEVLSFASYVVAFRAIFGGRQSPVGWRESYRITMAGVVGTRLLASAGIGGIVLTMWALGRLGMALREAAARTATLLVVLYGIYMATLVVGGIGLRTGLLEGPATFGLTIVPALFGGAVIVLALAAMRFAATLETVAARFEAASGGAARWVRAAVTTTPAALSSGLRGALSLVQARSPALPAAFGWWAFDIATLVACMKAFGGSAPVSVVVMAYFVGMLANTLPVPGGIGAVEGGMIGALIAFGVNSGLAIVAVLSYRVFAFWLPIAPGALAYFQLLRAPRVHDP